MVKTEAMALSWFSLKEKLLAIFIRPRHCETALASRACLQSFTYDLKVVPLKNIGFLRSLLEH